MPALEWDCDLEKQALEIINKDDSETVHDLNDHGYNHYVEFEISEEKKEVDFKKDLKPALKFWFNKVKSGGNRDSKNRMTNEDLSPYAYMANDKNTKIGCGYNVSVIEDERLVTFLCLYDKKVEVNDVIYEVA
ncbi:hypothetical protein ANCDUO_20753 [Ancylostoma duodenale]|uniref:SCP domain-containing protein n=1 Tax=Ancylostoma duodenale TaxID=51022 RepID=A0A0C2BZ06_9BILA|nr:hypothetical protein ANCDUO_20753 [Ancylostoma duodenale]